MNYNEAEKYISSFTKSGKPQTELSRFRALCKNLGDPQKKLRFIHIAGTNGKGSVSEYLSCAFIAAGMKTGCFTSPFIVELRERIRLNGENIGKEAFAECCSEVKAAAEGCSDYSQFEIFTAVAFLFYAREKADIVVLETGIGGLYDCTNIVEPECSVITMIDFDHCALLGNTIPEIAAHKAGIIKPGKPVFVSPFQRQEALLVLKEKAAETGSDLTEADGKRLSIVKNSLFGTEFIYKDKRFSTAMGGAHQPENAAAAIEALRFMKIPEAAIEKALCSARLPARMQVYREKPLIIIDGGHNESGALAAEKLLAAEGIRPVMVLGMLGTKDWKDSLSILLKQARRAIFCDSFYPQAVAAEQLAEYAKSLGVPSEAVSDTKNALEAAMAADGDGFFVGGSLYLAGEAIRILRTIL